MLKWLLSDQRCNAQCFKRQHENVKELMKVWNSIMGINISFYTYICTPTFAIFINSGTQFHLAINIKSSKIRKTKYSSQISTKKQL